MRPRSIAALALVGVVLTACSASVPENAGGEEIYLQLCARCHGEDLGGRVGPPLGPDSPVSEQPDEYLVFTIEHGRGRMPSFSSTLDERQVEELATYIRTVQLG